MLAHRFTGEQFVGGWFASEKLDGQRFWWDGGISRGTIKSSVPYANNERDTRFKIPPVATGLWSRYGNVIHAPNWFLDELPDFPIDGELYSRNLSRQQLSSIIKKLEPDCVLWQQVSCNVFDYPNYKAMAASRSCYGVNWHIRIPWNTYKWVEKRVNKMRKPTPYWQVYKALKFMLKDNTVCNVVDQIELPATQEKAISAIWSMHESIISQGGEGLMIRDPNKCYETVRSNSLLKVKSRHTDEGRVIGWTKGKDRHEGALGSLLVDYKGHELSLSGMSDEERILHNGQPFYFPIGTIVTFSYRGFTDSGIPQEAAYECIRND